MVPIAHVSFVKFARGALGGRLGSPCRMVPARPVLETMYNSHGGAASTVSRFSDTLSNCRTPKYSERLGPPPLHKGSL
jgi:hypothetical protein